MDPVLTSPNCVLFASFHNYLDVELTHILPSARNARPTANWRVESSGSTSESVCDATKLRETARPIGNDI